MKILDAVSPLERVQLSRELTAKVKGLKANESPLSQVRLSREVAAILKKLGAGVVPVDLVFDLAQPEATRASLAAYLETGIAALPEALQACEARTVMDLATQVGDRELAWKAQAIAGEYAKSFGPAFNEVVGRGLKVSIEAEGLAAKLDQAEAIGKELYTKDEQWIALQDELRGLNATRSEKMATIEQKMRIAKQAYMDAHARGDADVADTANELMTELVATRRQMQAEYEKGFDAASKKADERAKAFRFERAERATALVRAEGNAVIDAVKAKSPVSAEQAMAWALSQNVEPAAIKRLARAGYRKEALLQDMADFYQLSGGKSSKVSIVTNGGRRAYTTNVVTSTDEKIIAIDGDFNRTVLFHELAHHLENDPIAQAAANGYLEKRRESTKLYSLRSLTGSKGYGAGEAAYKDHFLNAYIGKVYSDKTTEVFSMAVQYLASPLDAARMYAKDPELFALVSGYLGSSLTPAMKARLSLHTGKIEEKVDLENKVAEAIAEAAETVTLKPSSWYEEFKKQNEWDLRFAIGRIGGDYEKMKPAGSYPQLALHVLEGPIRTTRSGRRSKGYVVLRETGGRPDAQFAGRTMEEAKAFVAAAIKENGFITEVKSKYFGGASEKTIAAIKSLSEKVS